MVEVVRLDKFLADMGVGTRTQVKEYIKKGTIRVNEQIERNGARKIFIRKDLVCFKEEIIAYESYEYFMLNKPQGVISATEDKKQKTVLDLISDKKRKDLFPVGRLDKDTEGLLLITNDGALAHSLLAPKKHVSKYYDAIIDGVVDESHIAKFSEGISINENYTTMPAKLSIQKIYENKSYVEIIIQEGKFHQIKKMFEALELEVIYLKRTRMGALILDEKLKPGEFRPLTDMEMECLKGFQKDREDIC